MESDERGTRQRSHWSQWATWMAGGFAVTANVVGVIELATAHRLLLSLIVGVLAVGGGALWLWRLSVTGQQLRFRRQIFALNLAMVVVGAGLIGAALAGQREAASSNAAGTPGPAATSGTPRTSIPTPAPAESSSVAPDRRQLFTGTIKFRFPRDGNTLTPGQSVSGEVTGWLPGYQVWLSTQPAGGRETVHGRCTVAGTSWECPGVQLAGHPGDLEHLLVVVLPDAVADQLAGGKALPVRDAVEYDQVEVYKG